MSDVKTYLHPIKNSTFVVQRAPGVADTLMFANGKMHIPLSDKQAIEQLDSIANKPGSMVTTEHVAELTDAKIAAAQVVQLAGDHAAKIAAGTKPQA